MKNILFICTMNKWRSRTAETIFKNKDHIHVKSAGTSSKAVVRINAELINWADEIYVMEDKHKAFLKDKFRNELSGIKVNVLHIEDVYQYMDPELIEILEESV